MTALTATRRCPKTVAPVRVGTSAGADWGRSCRYSPYRSHGDSIHAVLRQRFQARNFHSDRAGLLKPSLTSQIAGPKVQAVAANYRKQTKPGSGVPIPSRTSETRQPRGPARDWNCRLARQFL